MRAFTWTMAVVMAVGVGVLGCAEKREEELPQIDPAELEATAPAPGPEIATLAGTPTVEVETPAPGVPGQTVSAPETYMVQKGDGLMAIARRFYGDASMWRKIYEANRNTITSPDVIKVGWVLTIPPK